MYPDITPAERQKLVSMGWLFNPRAGIWMFAPNDISFSTEQKDHDRKFADDVAWLRGAQNYATAGDTGS